MKQIDTNISSSIFLLREFYQLTIDCLFMKKEDTVENTDDNSSQETL